MCPLQDPREAHLRSCRTNHRPIAPIGEAGFRHGRSTVDQVTLLKQDIDDSFTAKKTGVVYVGPTAAYATVWHRGLICKLLRLRLLPGRHMVHIIMEMVGSRSFTLATGTNKQSRLRRLKNGVPQRFRTGNASLQYLCL